MRAALTIVPPSTSPVGQRVLRLGLYLGILFTAIAILLLALAPFGWRVGWWGYRFSLLTLMPYAAYAGLAAVIVSALLLLFARRAIGARGGTIVLAAMVAGGLVAYVPWHYRALARRAPPIDDITTDTNNPPAFIALVPLRKAEHSNPSTYAGAKTARLQKQGYPDIAPLLLTLGPDKAFALALATAKEMDWAIVATDPGADRIEADQRSFWMGFTDDIVLRVTASGSGSRVDMRSASRHGRSDLGVNAARVRAYLARLKMAAGAS
jgi:uncharacterized protein (DUF1499 family)